MTSRFSSTVLYPRAAVAITVQSCHSNVPQYLLVRRANPPDQGKWSLPGGKIEIGESTMDAAKRELCEETRLENCDWLSDPFMTTDAILVSVDKETKTMAKSKDSISFHYLIAQCFARVPKNDGLMPDVVASDDALDAKWYSLMEIQKLEPEQISQNVAKVVQRAEELFEKGCVVLST